MQNAISNFSNALDVMGKPGSLFFFQNSPQGRMDKSVKIWSRNFVRIYMCFFVELCGLFNEVNIYIVWFDLRGETNDL